ncbi:hypothetical protein [Chitinophaga sp. CF418]|uniref:hypothetical protein n=1 Tax=Chitinophaga sp. CF418 TaxID=1855287 RepID=UPI00091497AA|nr:hypothetical protein [Chitinophaga sp. CF418]SHN36083.1 hypothetical protein SAMN05216311_11055 [Chitinophaga sp. CF418]
MKYAFIAALLFTHICTSAQTPAEGEAAGNEKVKVIRLDAKRYRAKGELLLRLSGIKVIPLCADTSQLGFVQVGITNRKIRAVPDKPYTPYLQDFVNTILGGVYVPSGRQMLWVIKDLRINETTETMSEHAFVRLKADAYVPADNSEQPTYRLLKAFDTVLIKGGMDVTGKHDKNIAQAIQLFYLACEDAAGAYSSGTSMTEAAIIDNILQPFKAPIYQDTAYKKGIYFTYQEFLANAPAISDFEIEAKTRKKILVYTTGSDNIRKEVRHMWGVSYKGELYKYDAGELIPIERKGNAFVLSKYMDDINRRNKSIFWGSVAFGIVGGGIAYTSTGVHTATAIPEIMGFGPEATAVDVESGDLVF